MRMLVPALIVLAAAAPLDDARAPSFGPSFWEHWGDGYAELAGYDLQISRYGEERSGVAVAVFVTETFSKSSRVKADPGRHPAADELPVMKLNLVYDFQTGVYDYNVMTSIFVGLEPSAGRAAGSPTKISFSSQEWCGHVYHQLLFDEDGIRETRHSYFDGEGDQNNELTYPAGGISEDALMHWARGLAAPGLRPAESVTVPLLPSLLRSRLHHEELAWTEVTLARASAPQRTRVPAGDFEVDVYTATIRDGPTRTYRVETAAPHRIVEWSSTDGERGRLLSSKRLKYWQLNDNGGDTLLSQLGLKRRPPRTP